MKEVLTIILTVLGSTGLFSFMTFLITRKDSKAEKVAEINSKLDSVIADQKTQLVDLTRTQLMLLISTYPTRKDEIITAAHRYFVELKGNWIMEPLFEQWLKDNGITIPSWYNKGGKQ